MIVNQLNKFKRKRKLQNSNSQSLSNLKASMSQLIQKKDRFKEKNKTRQQLMKGPIVIHPLCTSHDKVLGQYLASNPKKFPKLKFLNFLCHLLTRFVSTVVNYLILRKLKSLSTLKFTLQVTRVFRKYKGALIWNTTLATTMKMAIIRSFTATILVIDTRLSSFQAKEALALLFNVLITKQKRKSHLNSLKIRKSMYIKQALN